MPNSMFSLFPFVYGHFDYKSAGLVGAAMFEQVNSAKFMS